MSVPAFAAAGDALPLTLSLVNAGPECLQVLLWQAAHDGFGPSPWVQLSLGDEPMWASGLQVLASDAHCTSPCLELKPGARHSAMVDLASLYDLRRPGRYRFVPRLNLLCWNAEHLHHREVPCVGVMAAADIVCEPREFELR